LSFVLGAADEAAEKVLQSWLNNHGATRPVRITRDDPSCVVDSAADTAFPVGAWKKERGLAVLMLGPESCARTLLEALRRAHFAPPLLLGFDTAHLRAQYRRSVAIKSGAFPDRIPQGEPPGEAVNWYRALGHDAALLARSALGNLPDSVTTDPKKIDSLKERTAAALRLARVPLWTTAEGGFTQGTQIERRLETLENE
jgi:hypothetical protein